MYKYYRLTIAYSKTLGSPRHHAHIKVYPPLTVLTHALRVRCKYYVKDRAAEGRL